MALRIALFFLLLFVCSWNEWFWFELKTLKRKQRFWMEEGYPRSKFKRVCVFCGSNSGNRQVFSDSAIQLGNELVCSYILYYSSLSYAPFLKIWKDFYLVSEHLLCVVLFTFYVFCFCLTYRNTCFLWWYYMMNCFVC